MTDKELKRLSRSELLEILLAQSRKIEKMQEKIDVLQDKIRDRAILMQNVGSIAEASLELNKVMEAAQKAADQYTENVKQRSDLMLAETEEFIREVIGQLSERKGSDPELEKILNSVTEKRRGKE